MNPLICGRHTAAAAIEQQNRSIARLPSVGGDRSHQVVIFVCHSTPGLSFSDKTIVVSVWISPQTDTDRFDLQERWVAQRNIVVIWRCSSIEVQRPPHRRHNVIRRRVHVRQHAIVVIAGHVIRLQPAGLLKRPRPDQATPQAGGARVRTAALGDEENVGMARDLNHSGLIPARFTGGQSSGRLKISPVAVLM